jgi:hypothetical protein
MNEPNRLRLERMTARYGARIAAANAAKAGDEESFLQGFAELRDRVIRPMMEACAAPLRAGGHDSRVLVDEGESRPSIELALGLRAGSGTVNRVGFAAIRWEGHPLQILAYLVLSPPKFDLERWAGAEEITRERVEKLLVDAVEHILATNVP